MYYSLIVKKQGSNSLFNSKYGPQFVIRLTPIQAPIQACSFVDFLASGSISEPFHVGLFLALYSLYYNMWISWCMYNYPVHMWCWYKCIITRQNKAIRDGRPRPPRHQVGWDIPLHFDTNPESLRPFVPEIWPNNVFNLSATYDLDLWPKILKI